MKKIITEDSVTWEEVECVSVYSEIDDKWYVDV